MRYRGAIILAAVAVVAVGLGVSAYFLVGRPPAPSSPSSSQPSGRPTGALPPQSQPIAHVMITQDAADAVDASSTNGAAFVRSLNKPATFEVVHVGRAESDLLPAATHVESFKSYGAIQRAFADGTIPADVRVIQYDDEHWIGTPMAEQQQPFSYVQQAERLVHQHRLLFMVTPGADLKEVLDPNAVNQYSAYLTDRLAGLAKFADVFEIQAQNATSVSQYLSFATQAAAQAKQANDKAIVLLGVTAKDGGQSSSAIDSEIAGTVGIADGYWFNIPSTSSGSASGVTIALPVIQDWAKL
jgi:hypothetical protein